MENLPRLSDAQGQVLVSLARRTLSEKLGRRPGGDAVRHIETRLSDPAMVVPGGVFVTLKIDGCLRGCIGTLAGHDTLVENVRTYAEHAAFDDPRFAPLTAEELDQVAIEVSVLTVPQPLAYTDADDLLRRLRPETDGVILRKKNASATFLPQVWAQLPRPEDFLAQLCLKAGLPADAWRTEHLDVETYQVQSFEEGR
ncbi:MAG: AmmeMemoRadiSam system protein A [Desulfatitalea sp.]|nr:AmmeMemoRadiSam system protein A [Desulfatitalea sp.]